METSRSEAGTARPRRAVLLMAYGGPRSLDEVEPYLLEVRGGRPTPPELVEKVRARYAAIGGRSPLLEITRAQGQALEDRLNEAAGEYRVYVGMRHWHPYIREAVARIAESGLRDVVALCLAPHYSRMSVGAYFAKVREAQEALGTGLAVAYVESWHDHPLFVEALAEKVAAARERFPGAERDQVQVVFTAHSLPAAIVAQGDPYEAQLRETARLVAARLGLAAGSWQLAYQSAGGGQARWLGPSLDEVIPDLARAGRRQILVAPIGFVADHVEILYDLDVEARQLAEQAGARLERTESLNTTPRFVEALADVVLTRARGGER